MNESSILDLTIVIVTSPHASMPSTAIIEYVIRSFELIAGLNTCPIKIVMDGYKVTGENRMKKGRITADTEELYEEYYNCLREKFADAENYEILRSKEHLGFAHCVKFGLEHCTTTYAFVAQHDRFFTKPFDRLQDLLQAMNDYPHVRYIGFPSRSNVTHDKSLQFVYHLGILNESPIKIKLDNNFSLQPLIFWFDSQHLCHVERYLKIFQPYKSIPAHLKDLVGLTAIKDMFLKPGDFIEDKFGQVQRNLLIQFAAKVRAANLVDPDETSTNTTENKITNEIIIDLFKWYGSYLCWITNPVGSTEVNEEEEGEAEEIEDSHAANQAWIHSKSTDVTMAMVSHMHGRHFNVSKMQTLVDTVGFHRIKSKKFLRLLDSSIITGINIPSETIDVNIPSESQLQPEGNSQL
jgi:hypothetical protein